MTTHSSTPVSLAGRVTIRAARADEGLAVAATHVQADQETYQPIFGPAFKAVELERSQLRWDAAIGAGDVFLVAEADGRIVGFGHATPTWMSALYLLASHRRQGIGARLLIALCGELRMRGVDEIGFQAVSDNVEAIAFYQALGARPVGRKREGEGDETWDDTVFALATDAPAASRRA